MDSCGLRNATSKAYGNGWVLLVAVGTQVQLTGGPARIYVMGKDI